MKLTKSLCLILSLLITPIKARANDDTILNKGDRAPFYGVLVDDNQYRKFTEGLRTEDFINKNPSDIGANKEMGQNEKILLGFLAGFGAGIILMISK